MYGSTDTKLVLIVENYLQDLWVDAERIYVRELNSYELEYEITNTDEKIYLVNLVARSCS